MVPPATHESTPHYSHSSPLTALQSRPVFILHLQTQRQPSVGGERGGKRSSAPAGLFRRLLSPFLSLSFLSLSFSYTIRSEVKQAALRWVCSSLTPRLQTNSGQDEEGGAERGPTWGEAYTPKMNNTTPFLYADLYSNRAVS